MSTVERDQEDFHKRVKYSKNKAAHMKPKGKRGRIAVARLGRNYKTGNFEKGVADIQAKGLSKESAEKIMGAQYWKKVRGRK